MIHEAVRAPRKKTADPEAVQKAVHPHPCRRVPGHELCPGASLSGCLPGDNVCVVGDDDQTIYRFRGAYLTNFQDFREQYASCNEILLSHNYRNSQTILTLALELMKHAPNRQEEELITQNPPGDPVIVAECENEAAEVTFVLSEIETAPWTLRSPARDRVFVPGDFAIICPAPGGGSEVLPGAQDAGDPGGVCRGGGVLRCPDHPRPARVPERACKPACRRCLACPDHEDDRDCGTVDPEDQHSGTGDCPGNRRQTTGCTSPCSGLRRLCLRMHPLFLRLPG